MIDLLKTAPLLFAGLAALWLADPAPLPASQAEPAAVAEAPAPAETVAAPVPAAAEPAPSVDPRPDSVSELRVVRELPVQRWLEPGEYVWDAEGAPQEPAVVVVNIRARVLSVYRGGVEIGRSSILYGADDKPTPTGVFPVLQKRRDHVSNLYNAPMPHMLRLTWDGVAIHGSPELANDIATRGCIGLPREFAALLFDVVGVGDRVIVWSGTRGA